MQLIKIVNFELSVVRSQPALFAEEFLLFNHWLISSSFSVTFQVKCSVVPTGAGVVDLRGEEEEHQIKPTGSHKFNNVKMSHIL